jgi:hypothetical protein
MFSSKILIFNRQNPIHKIEQSGFMEITYNSSRPDLIIPEYGRNIQSMVSHCLTISDRDERNRCARAIISIMGNLFPYLRDVDDYNHKLWDHLHVMSDFQLDVDSPYPKPARETFQEKPQQVPYPTGKPKYGHYGKTITRIIDEVKKEEDPEQRERFTVGVANLMKRMYVVWNQNSVRDEQIAADLEKLSDGELKVKNPEEALDSNREVMQQMGVNKNKNQGGHKRGKKRSHGRKGPKGPRKKRN